MGYGSCGDDGASCDDDDDDDNVSDNAATVAEIGVRHAGVALLQRYTDLLAVGGGERFVKRAPEAIDKAGWVAILRDECALRKLPAVLDALRAADRKVRRRGGDTADSVADVEKLERCSAKVNAAEADIQPLARGQLRAVDLGDRVMLRQELVIDALQRVVLRRHGISTAELPRALELLRACASRFPGDAEIAAAAFYIAENTYAVGKLAAGDRAPDSQLLALDMCNKDDNNDDNNDNDDNDNDNDDEPRKIALRAALASVRPFPGAPVVLVMGSMS
eukprot:TRINITY_DN5873_c2_g1_i1.p2 TRINITY_DN5873_c2_g1~~TRINITY_DN5873_c2_g1_i1.p2  ORF type:complete len:277 (-),score=102.43 TRINITY_DN5873_c2_g1_i1:604-1434(-)